MSNQRVRCVFFWKNFQVAAQYTEKQKGPPHFIVKLFENKGRGIVAQQDFSNGEFLLEYPGELITAEEGNLREEESSGFLFFKHQGQSYCLDATDECAFADRLGHLMNHGQGMEENAQVKILDLKSHPHMCIFASKNIYLKGPKYNYGIRDLPWQKKQRPEERQKDGGQGENKVQKHIQDREGQVETRGQGRRQDRERQEKRGQEQRL